METSTCRETIHCAILGMPDTPRVEDSTAAAGPLVVNSQST
jgi:hypothetical protein